MTAVLQHKTGQVFIVIWCAWEQHPEKRGRGKTSTKILKASRQDGLQQFQVESCQPIKR